MINIYSQNEIEVLKKSGKILSEVLHLVAEKAVAGVSMYELNAIAEKEIRERGGVPAFLGYKNGDSAPYPASLCASINDEVVHCIPYKDRIAREGDIIGLDLGVKYKNFITDMAMTVAIGRISQVAKNLIDDTRRALNSAISVIRPGATLGDVGYAIQKEAEAHGFGVIRDLVGHGVGHNVHEDPQIPNFGHPGKGLALKPGMVLAIEPMFAEKSYKLAACSDGWGIKTADGGFSAHFEKTIAVTKAGCEILT